MDDYTTREEWERGLRSTKRQIKLKLIIGYCITILIKQKYYC